MSTGGVRGAQLAMANDSEDDDDAVSDNPGPRLDAETTAIVGYIGEYLASNPHPMIQLLLGQMAQIEVEVAGQDGPSNLTTVAGRACPTFLTHVQLNVLAGYREKAQGVQLGDWDPVTDQDRGVCSWQLLPKLVPADCATGPKSEMFQLGIELRTQAVLHLCDRQRNFSIDTAMWERCVRFNISCISCIS